MRATFGAGDIVEATLKVRNSGAVAGEDVVQLYVRAIGSKVERAPRELKAFARVALEPGETKTVSLSLPVAELAYYEAGTGWVVEPIDYEVIVGRHAADAEGLTGEFRVR